VSATDRAARLDSEVARVRAQLEAAPPVASVNPAADALARILAVPAADAATWRDFFLVAVAELLIAGALAAFEALRPASAATTVERQAPGLEVVSVPPQRSRAQARLGHLGHLVTDAGGGTHGDARQDSPTPDRRPGNVVPIAAAKPAAGSVESFMLTCVKRARGATVTWAELYVRYRRWCEEQSPALAPLDPEAFGSTLDALRSEGVIRARARGQDVHCLDVRLSA
jgi:hypothetical protein